MPFGSMECGNKRPWSERWVRGKPGATQSPASASLRQTHGAVAMSWLCDSDYCTHAHCCAVAACYCCLLPRDRIAQLLNGSAIAEDYSTIGLDPAPGTATLGGASAMGDLGSMGSMRSPRAAAVTVAPSDVIQPPQPPPPTPPAQAVPAVQEVREVLSSKQQETPAPRSFIVPLPSMLAAAKHRPPRCGLIQKAAHRPAFSSPLCPPGPP